jgi:hypothetical protein
MQVVRIATHQQTPILTNEHGLPILTPCTEDEIALVAFARRDSKLLPSIPCSNANSEYEFRYFEPSGAHAYQGNRIGGPPSSIWKIKRRLMFGVSASGIFPGPDVVFPQPQVAVVT